MERVRDAATVILVREQPDLQVFVLRRNPDLVFAPGATVFPGGAVDPVDAVVAAELGVDEFRAAAARECLEECGIPIDARELVEFARWVTPVGAPRRYDTRFFVARSPDGHVGEHDGSELVASAWMRPADVLQAFADGDIDLILPTQRSLEILTRFDRVEALLANLREAPCPT
ncbi:MAG TPA: NUDIX hydrolase [Acidimicrobiia bacterium]|jgi:8-oxo-dGTP pyrophosphatase MutT (NUDIX family)|nr:NUDIX hydrolase [Acidimicrobiia bacterium]